MPSPKTGPIGHWIKQAMLVKPAHKIEKAGGLPELKETVEVKLVFRLMRKSKLATGHEERRFAAKGGRLYLNEALLAVGLK